MSLTVGSLFSGIGGLDLGLERAGMTVKWQSEIDPYCSRVLVKHWPEVPNLGDVTQIEWEEVERVDLICGGYPCQPFSLAGARRGHTDDRHLWPYMADALRVLRPRFALLENVPGHLSLGFGDVLADLAALGYDTEWDCIPAVAVGALHRRDRVFIIANAASGGRDNRDQGQSGGQRQEVGWGELAVGDGAHGPVADTARTELGRAVADTGGGRRSSDDVRAGWDAAGGSRSIVADAKELAREVERLGRCRGSLGEFWTIEPDVGRVAHGVPRRVDRLRALGNAVVPQIAEFIGSQLLASLRSTA